MSNEIDQDDVLDDFAMEMPVGPETLRSYIEKYPKLATELTDLYHELLMVDLSAQADGMQLETKSAFEAADQNLAVVARALSGAQLRDLAQELGLPRDFIAGFRDRKIRLGSIPGNLLTNLAQSASVSVHHMIGYLQNMTAQTPHMAHKADEKPRSSTAVEYDEFVDGLGLSKSELEALTRLSASNGSD